MQQAYWQAYIAAKHAQENNGFISVRRPGVNDLMTPVTTNKTIPRGEQQSPFGPSYDSMDMAVKNGYQKGSPGIMAGADLFSNLQEFAPADEAGSASKLPTWAWLAIAAGLYLVLKGK